MDPTRAFGHLRPPTPEQLAAYAERLGLHPTTADRELWSDAIAAELERLDRLEELEQPSVPLRHIHRDPGRPPRPGEDPYNAVIRFCEVRGSAEGSLAGRTLGVKDCISVAGVPTTNGGRRIPTYVPTEDAVVVERLLDAGVTITAKLNLDDSGWGIGETSAYGAAHNPLDPRFLTGGSSSGSGAAVAAGIVDLAIGADEGGSVRIPAAWCGLVGMKATHGLVPSYGMTYMDHTIDHIGPITRTVADSASMLEVMAGSDWRDPQWVRSNPCTASYAAAAQDGIEGLRIGVVVEALEPAGCTPDVLSGFTRAEETLRSLGAEVGPVSVPLWPNAGPIEAGALGFGVWAMVQSGGAGFGHLGRIDPEALAMARAQARLGADHLPPFLQMTLLTTEHLREAYLGIHYAKGQNLRLEMRRQVSGLFSDYDLLITPTVPTVAAERHEGRATAAQITARFPKQVTANTSPLNLTGHPALTLPCGTGTAGLPIGLQLIGPHFGEEAVYRAAFAFEAARVEQPHPPARGATRAEQKP